MKETVYETVTNRIIAAIEADPGKLTMPWHRTKGKALAQPINALTSNAYRGINTLMLWVTADMASFDTPVWATYRQWATLGAQVRGGEKSTPIIFYKEYDAAPDPSDPDDTGRRRVARASAVFNATQVDGYAAPPPAVDHGPVERYARFDALVEATGAVINRNGKQAFYMPSTDSITMPAEGLFIDTDTRTRSEAYAAILAHELAHWSGAKHRLNRQLADKFDRHAYACEELIAELTAAYICVALGITPEPRADHAQYMKGYVELLKSDSRAIFTAAAHAARAADYMQGIRTPPQVTAAISEPATLPDHDLNHSLAS